MRMLKTILLALVAAFRSRRQLALENLALRHQLEVLQRTIQPPRPFHVHLPACDHREMAQCIANRSDSLPD
jgi:hypothetical protein